MPKVMHEDLTRTIEYDLEQERNFRYKGLSQIQIIEHLAKFVSGIWQIHPFPEGNTRTTAVFTIKYLRSMGYGVENDMFKSHSWYFRNALVRANYRNVIKGIESTHEYIVLFFRNLLLGEKIELKNRYLHIRWNDTKPQDEISEIPKSHSENSSVEFSMKEKVVLDAIRADKHISILSLVKSTGIPRSTFGRIIKSLKEKGVLERRGVKNFPEWIVK